MPISPETPLNRGFQGIKKNKCSYMPNFYVAMEEGIPYLKG
tara:strand:+ start:124 stop:246 length:123 start_codon:yes stop_codon:yes gene_type:complete